MAEKKRTRRLLHLDLTPFFVAVERALDPALDGRPVIVGGEGTFGRVAAASLEAHERGVRVGQSVAAARRLCPEAVLRPGDLEMYARLSDEVSSVALGLTPRVLRPSADEAVADLTAQAPTDRHFVLAAEWLRDTLRTRLGLGTASLGLASTRLGARLAARWARPRGMLFLLPAHEMRLLERVPLATIEDLTQEDLRGLAAAGIDSLAAAYAASPTLLVSLLGRPAAAHVASVLGSDDPIPPATPPAEIDEEAVVRDAAADRAGIEVLVSRLAIAAARRLRPFGLATGSVHVELRRAAGQALSRTERLASPSAQPGVVAGLARRATAALLPPAARIRSMRVRLSDLQPEPGQGALFPEMAAAV